MLALAALSARPLAGWAVADGEPGVALDVFGDADTRAAAREWHAIGAGSGPPRIDGARLLAELGELARRGTVDALVAGSGFEDAAEVLERAARILPLLGTAPVDQQRLADARSFFAFLDAGGIAHPPVAFEPPGEPGWLHKRGRSFGGYGVRRASARARAASAEPGDAARRAAGGYWQRERPGPCCSATFVANGERAVVLGLNRQASVAIGRYPFVFAGVAGPLALPDRVMREIAHALAQLVPEYRLRGLGSIDFMLGGDGTPELIEVNARPSASAALYPVLDGRSPLRAHRRACREGLLPAVPAGRARGLRVVHARVPLQLGAAAAAHIAATPGAHDLPSAGSRFGAGDPLCTLGAEGADASAVEAQLLQAASRLLDTVENLR